MKNKTWKIKQMLSSTQIKVLSKLENGKSHKIPHIIPSLHKK